MRSIWKNRFPAFRRGLAGRCVGLLLALYFILNGAVQIAAVSISPALATGIGSRDRCECCGEHCTMGPGCPCRLLLSFNPSASGGESPNPYWASACDSDGKPGRRSIAFLDYRFLAMGEIVVESLCYRQERAVAKIPAQPLADLRPDDPPPRFPA